MGIFSEPNRDAYAISVESVAVPRSQRDFLTNFRSDHGQEAAMIPLMIAAIAVGVLTARVTIIAARGATAIANPAQALIGTVSSLVVFSLLVWGFVAVTWYWPVLGFLAGIFAGAIFVTRQNWAGFWRARPLLDIAVIAAGAYLWLWHWPFG